MPALNCKILNKLTPINTENKLKKKNILKVSGTKQKKKIGGKM